jgi:peroxiredoxin Q/BCP
MSKETQKKTGKKSGKPRTGAPSRSGRAAKTSSAAKATVTRSAGATTGRKVAAGKTAAKNAATKPGLLAEGDSLSPFFLPRDGGQTVSLADFSGRKLVIFFYPRADTPGCTLEASDFSRLAPAFAASQTAILGVSADPVTAQEKFRDKHQLAVPLASDEQHKVLDLFGVWAEKSMYGKTFMGILRTTVLVDADGRIARIWRNVRVPGHAEEVLAAARDL